MAVSEQGDKLLLADIEQLHVGCLIAHSEVALSCAVVSNVERQITKLSIVRIELVCTSQNAESTRERGGGGKCDAWLPEAMLNLGWCGIWSDGIGDELCLELVDDIHPVDVGSVLDGGEELLSVLGESELFFLDE